MCLRYYFIWNPSKFRAVAPLYFKELYTSPGILWMCRTESVCMHSLPVLLSPEKVNRKVSERDSVEKLCLHEESKTQGLRHTHSEEKD